MVTKLGVILRGTTNTFESSGVLNPAVYQEGNKVHLFYRAFRDGNLSTLGYCLLDGPTQVAERKSGPVFLPQGKEEAQGVEDARLVNIEGKFYLTYTAYDGHNALGAVATSANLENFERIGVITPRFTFHDFFNIISGNEKLNRKYFSQYSFLVEHGMMEKVSDYLIWDKNLLLFPEKIDGQFVLLHRLFPGIQLVKFNTFSDLTREFWTQYLSELDSHIVMDPHFSYETSHIGGGCPPIRTDKGWLLIYHAVEATPSANIYHVSAAMLDAADPGKVIARLKVPLISPVEDYEKNGYVSNVCFPTGTAIFDNDLYIYYGAADSAIAVAKVNLNQLINELITNNAFNI